MSGGFGVTWGEETWMDLLDLPFVAVVCAFGVVR